MAVRSTNTNNPMALKYLANAVLTPGRTNRKTGVPLNLTLRFGEDRFVWSKLGVELVNVTIGIRETYINFELCSCSFPEADWAVNPVQPQSVVLEQSISNVESTVVEYTKSNRSAAKPSFDITDGMPASNSTFDRQKSRKNEDRSSTETRIAFSQEYFSVVARGTATSPSWHIRALPGWEMLNGTVIDNARFVVALTEGVKSQIDLVLDVPMHGYVFRADDGKMTSQPNRFGIIGLLIKKHVLPKRRSVAKLELQSQIVG
jgi:hypothetical protein